MARNGSASWGSNAPTTIDDARDRLIVVVQDLCAVVDAAPEIVELVCDPAIVRSDAVDLIEVRMAVSPVEPVDPQIRRL